MAPIQNEPFLAHLVRFLIKQGVKNFVLSLHYSPHIIQIYFQNQMSDVDVQFVVENEPLGTGGAICYASNWIHADHFFVLNGDTFLKLNYEAMFKNHIDSGSHLTVALHRQKDCSRYGRVEINDDHQIIGFKEKGQKEDGYINAGVYLIHRAWFQSLSLPQIFSFERDFLMPQVKRLKPQGFLVNDYFIDIGVPDDYARANCELLSLMK